MSWTRILRLIDQYPQSGRQHKLFLSLPCSVFWLLCLVFCVWLVSTLRFLLLLIDFIIQNFKHQDVGFTFNIWIQVVAYLMFFWYDQRFEKWIKRQWSSGKVTWKVSELTFFSDAKFLRNWKVTFENLTFPRDRK